MQHYHILKACFTGLRAYVAAKSLFSRSDEFFLHCVNCSLILCLGLLDAQRVAKLFS